MKSPLVSVIVLVYNHERFISKCLTSIIDQTYKNIEIIISDDRSIDNSLEIIRTFQGRESRIFVQQNEINLGPAGNFNTALKACKGEFIAICEGDDFWINPRKIEFQANLLIHNTRLGLIYANYAKVDDSGVIIKNQVLGEQPISFGLESMLDNHGPSTNSVMIRKEAFPKKFTKSFFNVLNPDVFIIGYGLRFGPSSYINKVLSNYRVHGKGIWSPLSTSEQMLHRYFTHYLFFKAIKRKNLANNALQVFERLVLSTRKQDLDHFDQFFAKLPLRKRFELRLKWFYSRIKKTSIRMLK